MRSRGGATSIPHTASAGRLTNKETTSATAPSPKRKCLYPNNAVCSGSDSALCNIC